MTVPVVLLHGLGGSPSVWDRLTPLLGGPVQAPRLVHPESLEADADAVAATLPSTRCVVVGHSRGGLVATALAERHGDRVASLVLVNAPPTVESRLTARSGGEQVLAVPLLGPLVWAVLPRAVASRGLASAFAPGTQVPDVFVDDLRETGHQNFLSATRAVDAYLAARPLRDRLAALDQAVNIVLGSLDQRVDVAAYAGWDELRTPVTRIPEAGHTPVWERPEAVAAVIDRAVRAASVEQAQ